VLSLFQQFRSAIARVLLVMKKVAGAAMIAALADLIATVTGVFIATAYR
jgi:hypothetical protein